MIELKNLTKIYPSKAGDVTALDDVSLGIPDGCVYGVIGLSGAGKSTLVRCIDLLERPTRGQVFLDGKELTALGKRELNEVRRSVGMIFQGFHLLEQRTAEENVCFPLGLAGFPRRKRRERARELLELVGLPEKSSAYPSQLSGGQKQRVAIARALAARPSYLLCDEATSALDPGSANAVLELLRKINRELGVTVVAVTHDMQTVEDLCTHVAVLDKGRVAEQGRVEDVFAFPKSAAARRLIFPSLTRAADRTQGKKLRLVFRGEEGRGTIVSELALQCGVTVDVLFAGTSAYGTFGNMAIALPREEEKEALVKRYLAAKGVGFEEV